MIARWMQCGATDTEAAGQRFQRSDHGESYGMNDDFDDAIEEEETKPEAEGRGVTLDDFVAYMPMHAYIFTPCREIWAGGSINARLPSVPLFDQFGQPFLNKKGEQIKIPPTLWLDRNRPVEQMKWCPGFPMMIPNRLVVLGGWIERPDVTTFNCISRNSI
jgi:hypothetical protein